MPTKTLQTKPLGCSRVLGIKVSAQTGKALQGATPIIWLTLAAVALAFAGLPASAQAQTYINASITVQNDRGVGITGALVRPQRPCNPSIPGDCPRFSTNGRGVAGVALYPGETVRVDHCYRSSQFVVPNTSQNPWLHTITFPSLMPQSYEPTLSSDERWLIGQLNAERARLGRPPVYIALTLSDAADRYAYWLSEYNSQILDHTALCTQEERAQDSGWPYGFNNANGETLAWSSQGATGAFQQWMESSGHYQLMTDATYGSVGIGRYRNIWVMHFYRLCESSRFGFERCGQTSDVGDASLPIPGPPPGAGGAPPGSGGSGGGAGSGPDTEITKSPARKSKKRKARFAFAASAANASFECSLDGGEFEPCTSPLKFKVSKGKHVFEVHAIDPAGRVDPTPASFDWRVKRRER